MLPSRVLNRGERQRTPVIAVTVDCKRRQYFPFDREVRSERRSYTVVSPLDEINLVTGRRGHPVCLYDLLQVAVSVA